LKFRALRQRRRGRIEIIPMIDVMFFLLATFMLASLSLQNLHSLAVNLPQGRSTPLQSASQVTLTVTKDGQLLLNEVAVTLDTLAGALRSMPGGQDRHIVVAVDRVAPSGLVVQAMLKAREAGAQHFVFAVSPN
jgi:biopolymer transport protein ExbD